MSVSSLAGTGGTGHQHNALKLLRSLSDQEDPGRQQSNVAVKVEA